MRQMRSCGEGASIHAGPALKFDVRFYPESDRLLRCCEMTRCANNDRSAVQHVGYLLPDSVYKN